MVTENTISIDELKVLQMDVLEAVHRFCKANNIRYSMACGTLLGAVRHKGYIPWDDDIDIYMLREDYEKFIATFPAKYEGIYTAISLETDKRWIRPYGKVYDIRTVMVENSNFGDLCGVNIDVFPIDCVPEDQQDWLHYDKYRRFFQRIFEFKIVRLSAKRNPIKNLALILGKMLLLPISTRRFGQFLSKYAQKYNASNSRCVFECVQGLFQKHPFRRTLFDDITEMPFEDRTFCAFSNFDEYLTNAYGDYMQLPPEEKRVTHHAFTAYWK
jgi:lipopolysaccharide cholinephosphotransferase